MASVGELNDCCAVNEIGRIINQKPETILKDLCQYIDWDYDPYDAYDDDGNEKKIKPLEALEAFYIFTGVEAYKKQKGVRKRKDPKYTIALAKYIKDHELGEVTAGPLHPNRVHHPDHMVRVYIWHPNKVNLTAWWKGRKPAVARTRRYW